MTYETKEQQRKRLYAEFLRRLREAPPGTRVYMAGDDLFMDADLYRLENWRAAHRVGKVRDDDDGATRASC
jgi:hypothetical protein